MRDLNSLKIEEEEAMKTRGITTSSSMTDIKSCNQPSLTSITVFISCSLAALGLGLQFQLKPALCEIPLELQ